MATSTDDPVTYSAKAIRELVEEEINKARYEWEHQPEHPQNVIQALAAVIRDLPGIAKDQDSTQGYKYRGIEAITREVSQLLGKYCVIFVPHVEERLVRDVEKRSGNWTRDELKVVYDVYGPGGPDDKITVGPLWGLGDDNSDKGANKSMTQAYKYALLQTLCIGDSKDDPDRYHTENGPREIQSSEPTPEQIKAAREHGWRLWEIQENIRALPDQERKELRSRWANHQQLKGPNNTVAPAWALSPESAQLVWSLIRGAQAAARAREAGWDPVVALDLVRRDEALIVTAVTNLTGGGIPLVDPPPPSTPAEPSTPPTTDDHPDITPSAPDDPQDGPPIPPGVNDQIIYHKTVAQLTREETAAVEKAWEEHQDMMTARIEWLAAKEGAVSEGPIAEMEAQLKKASAKTRGSRPRPSR